MAPSVRSLYLYIVILDLLELPMEPFCVASFLKCIYYCFFRYIKLYGMKFSKEDHLALINLVYELVVMPELELSLVQKYATQLISLLK